MGADRRRSNGQGVKQPAGVSGIKSLFDLVGCQPRKLSCLGTVTWALPVVSAAEYESDYASRHVLVDARQFWFRNGDRCFLENLATEAIEDRFVGFQCPTRRFPLAVVASAKRQDPIAIHDCSGNAHPMFALGIQDALQGLKRSCLDEYTSVTLKLWLYESIQAATALLTGR